MTDRVEEHDVAGAPSIDISTMSGDVILKTTNDHRVRIVLSGSSETVDNARIDVTGDSILVRQGTDEPRRRFFGRRMDIAVWMPPGGIARISSTAGDIRIRVPLTELDVQSGSGDVRVEDPVGEVRVKVASGDVTVAHAERDAAVSTSNGDIRIGHATDAAVSTASGTITLLEVQGSAQVKTASGDVRVRDFHGSDLEVKTMSGDVGVGLASGMVVDASIKTLSGTIRNKIVPTKGERAGRMRLVVHTFSGDITLRPAK